MSDRIFIIGAGRFGTHLAERLAEFGCEVVISDNNPKRVQNLADDGYHAVELEADDQDALREAGVADADIVVVSIGENMQASILSTLILKEMGAKKIIARAVDAKHAQVLEKVGADLVVVPSRDMAHGLAERLRSEFLSERMPISGDYQLAQVRIGSSLHGWTLAKANSPRTIGSPSSW